LKHHVFSLFRIGCNSLKSRFNRILLLNSVSTQRKGGTALQAGSSGARFPMVSLEFFTDILPDALWSWGRLSL